MSIPSDLVGEILVRLPLDSLMRFRRVCKTWQFMITNDPQIVHRCNELREIESKEAIRFQKEMQKMIEEERLHFTRCLKKWRDYKRRMRKQMMET
ncbi:putative F-box protein At3g10430 isoform X2 [Mercurialis annua]|uniref:putative F-box protein At3g10430 isoform X2 n=1 Tax=Mercurialis annua TaxID=3986 RepID=UPI00215E1152|nr:putative F-box protein At3g10430 isoform X2 [Mercurialis annua]